MPLDARARQIFDYFKSYNYTVKGTGEVITFQGRYQASIGEHRIGLCAFLFNTTMASAFRLH